MWEQWIKKPAGVRLVDGGITAVKGIEAAGVRCGIKEKGRDLALVLSRNPALFSAAYTTNKVQAASILRNKARLGGKLSAVVVNSGNANACTGPGGLKDAETMAAAAAEALCVGEDEILLAQTGVIGRRMPLDKALKGIDAAVRELSPHGGKNAVEAIMTTDRLPKFLAVSFKAGGKTITVGGMTKGAGMIEPLMATMLAFVFTDAKVTQRQLDKVFKGALDKSFHIISIDGDRSTNDTAVLAANGMARNEPLNDRDLELFKAAVEYVFRALAFMMVFDGEGATKLIDISVQGAATVADAKLAARAVGNSNLVKAAMFGRDPNWGRVIAAVGYSGARIDPERSELFFGGVRLLKAGVPVKADAAKLKKVMEQRVIPVRVNLNLGQGEAEFWASDLTYEYVEINAEYHT